MFTKRRAILIGSLIPAGIMIWFGCNAGTPAPGSGGVVSGGGLSAPTATPTGPTATPNPAGTATPTPGLCNANTTWNLTFTGVPDGINPGGGTATATLVLNAKSQVLSYTVMTGVIPQPILSNGDRVVVTNTGSGANVTMTLTIQYASKVGIGNSVVATGPLGITCRIWSGTADYRLANGTGSGTIGGSSLTP